MSDFALQFIPEGPMAPTITPPSGDPYAMRFIPAGEQQPQAVPDTNLLEQGMSGVNEGIGIGLGMPVDVVAGAINGVAGLAGQDPIVTDPVGGSQWFNRNVLAPTISDVDPQSTGQRYARRIGREVGVGAVTAPMMGAAAGPMTARQGAQFMGINAASDAASGVAGQTSREIAPDNNTADLIASMIAGTGAAGGITALSRTRPPAPTREAIQSRADAAYGRVRDSGAELTDEASQGFVDAIQRRFDDEGDALSHPRAAAQVAKLGKNPRQSVMGIDESRRRFRDHVARVPGEEAMGSILVDETERYLRDLQPNQISGANPGQVVDDLMEGRRAAHTGFKHDEVMDALDRAKRRAATSGTGGNALNAQAQEIGAIYDKQVARRPGPRGSNKSGGYTPDEIAAMERVVFPNRTESTLRTLGRMSPGSGAMGTWATGGIGGAGITGSLMTGNPLYAAASAIPTVTGIAAQTLAQRARRSNIEELVDTMLRGGHSVKKKAPNEATKALITQLLNSGLSPKQQ